MKITRRVQIQAISVAIVLIIGLQSLALFKPIRRTTWPFINYPMYKTPHFDGDRLGVRILLYANLDNGEIVEIRPKDVGLRHFQFFYHARCIADFPPKACGEPDIYAKRLADWYAIRSDDRILALTAKSYPAKITRNGVAPMESAVLGTVTLPDPNESGL